MENKGYLLLADGQLFEGTRFGAEKDVYAELVFTTAMTGYLETITDPSYEGQIVIQTFPTIGNYGVIPEDFESARPGLSAYVVREWCHDPSNFRCQGTLDEYLRREGIPGLCGLDTRRLTRRIRSAGVMNAALLMEKPENTDAVIAKLRALPFHPAVQDVSCKEITEGKTQGKYHVVLWDLAPREASSAAWRNAAATSPASPRTLQPRKSLLSSLMASCFPMAPEIRRTIPASLSSCPCWNCRKFPPLASAWAISCWRCPRGQKPAS